MSTAKDLEKAERRLATMLPEWEEARNAFERVDMKKVGLERDIEAFRIQMENEAWEDGTYHDQMAASFSLRTHGRNKRFVGHRSHRRTYDECKCEVQCPTCKRHNITVGYRKDRATGTIFDERPTVDRASDGFLYCPDCTPVVALDGDDE